MCPCLVQKKSDMMQNEKSAVEEDGEVASTLCPSEMTDNLDDLGPSNDVTDCERVICSMCNAKATDPTPLTRAEDIAKYGQYWPWTKYTRPTSVMPVRKPYSKHCVLCRNLFFVLGLNEKHTSLATFHKHTLLPNHQAEARSFSKQMLRYIKQLNAEGGGFRVKLTIQTRQELQKEFWTVVSVQSSTLETEGPDVEFVE